MDVEIAVVLKKRPILKPSTQPEDILNLKPCIIRKKHCNLVYKRNEGEGIQNCIFFFRDKHLYSTAALKTILSSAEAHKANSVADVKYVLDMIRWYLSVRGSLLKIMTKIFDVQRRQ